jgi:hypothetical protein
MKEFVNKYSDATLDELPRPSCLGNIRQDMFTLFEDLRIAA